METITNFTVPVYEFLSSLNWPFIIIFYMTVFIAHVKLKLLSPLNDTWAAAIIGTILAFVYWRFFNEQANVLRLFQSLIAGVFIHSLLLRSVQRKINEQIKNWGW